MSWYPDLGTVAMVDHGDHIRAVGWLSAEHSFPIGEVPADFLARLREFARRWWESTEALGWPICMGPHSCELCDSFMASGNFGVPSGGLLFVAPEMLPHYVEAHRYRPPDAFIAAVMQSPLPGTDEYRTAVEPFRRRHEMQILVRRATAEDAAALAAVEVASWRAAYRGLMPDAFLDQLSEDDHAAGWRRSLLKHEAAGRKRVLVALDGGAVIGFTRIGPASEENDAGLVYLLYVRPEDWGRGVGQALMRAAIYELRDLGFHEAVLWVLRDNSRARRFYERLGWRPDGQVNRENYGGIELEALCYRRAVGVGIGCDERKRSDGRESFHQ